VLGRLEEARRLGGDAIATAAARTDVEPDALHLLGDIAAHPDGFDAGSAESNYCRALASRGATIAPGPPSTTRWTPGTARPGAASPARCW
jgi:hypothetical protein